MKSQLLFRKQLTGYTPVRSINVKAASVRAFMPSQPAAFKALRKPQHVILNAPTGWGKSFVIAMLCLYKLLRNRKLRCIIVVPQTIIAGGFLEGWKSKLSKRVVDWVITHNLCGRELNKGKRLVQFLGDPHASLSDRLAICSHATLAKTFKHLRRRGKLHLLCNSLIWIDEAHHVMNAQVRGRAATRSNALGALVTFCVNNPKLNIHIGLATATFMRGDLRHILPDDLLAKFKRHNVPYDVYFDAMPPVKSFEFHVMCANYLDGIASIFREKVVPTIIYLPKRQSRYATNSKTMEVKRIIGRLAKLLRVKPRREGPVIQLGSLRVLDLVNEKGRAQRKEYLEQGGEIDIIIALDMCKEGFNWTKAERSIIIGERHSVPEMVQMIGRLFRQHPGKKHADIYQLLPMQPKNRSKFQDYRNRCLTVVFSSMLLEDVFSPLSFSTSRQGRKRVHRLADVFSDTDQWQMFMRDFDTTVTGMDYQETLPHRNPLLDKYGVSVLDREWVWRAAWTRYAMLERQQKGLKLNVSWEVLKHTRITDGLWTLCSGLCGAITFKELREIISRSVTRTPEQWVPIAEQLAHEHCGCESCLEQLGRAA